MYSCFKLVFSDVSTSMLMSFLNTDQYVHDPKIVNIILLKNDTSIEVETLEKTNPNMGTSEKQLNNVNMYESFNQFITIFFV